jgi:hypothetical protein
MYFIPAVLFALFACLFYVPGFLDTPLATLTARDVIAQVLFVCFGVISLAALARSIEIDPIWPWRPEFQRIVDWFMGRTP